MDDSAKTTAKDNTIPEAASLDSAGNAPVKGLQINTKRCSLLTIGMAGSGKTTFVKVF